MKKITIFIAAISTFGFAGCKKFLDQSVNPNAPIATTIPLALTGAEKSMADIPNGYGSQSFGGGLYLNYAFWVGYFAVSPGFITQPDYSEYVTTTTEFQPWTDLYLNLSNINNLEIIATAQASPNYQAIAMVMNAYDFEQLVDNYNNVPFTQAFSTKTLFPTYDKGADIYAALIKELDGAIALINKSTTAAVPAADDIIFGGNMTGWKKFANSLKLRLIMRQSNLPIFASLKAEMATTISEGFLDGSLEADAQPGYTLNDAYGGQESPFWHSYGTDQNGNPENSLVKANTFSVNLMNSFNDPRDSAIYQTVNGTVSGVFLGDPNLSNLSASAISNVGPGLLKSASQPAVVFSGAESLFLQAEAALDGIIPSSSGTAQADYEAGITASFIALGLQATDAAAYYSQAIPDVGWASSTNLQEAIITQKYIALDGYGVFEGYNEWRRTGYPVGVPRSLDQSTVGSAGQIPIRLLYPQVEYNTNATNVAAQGTINIFTSKIFWAK